MTIFDRPIPVALMVVLENWVTAELEGGVEEQRETGFMATVLRDVRSRVVVAI